MIRVGRAAGGSAFVGFGLATLMLTACGSSRPRSLSDCRSSAGHDQHTALMPACVDTVQGALRVEDEYLPGIVQCEVGGFRKTPAALEAQAIVARTYLLAHLLRKGPEARVRMNATFQCWKPPKGEAVMTAAARTKDVVMHRDGAVLDANYASGTPKRDPNCGPRTPREAGYDRFETWDEMRDHWIAARKRGERPRYDGVGWTELLITRNEGKDGLAVDPTPFAAARPTNRGAMGQWAAACLAGKRGYDARRILRYFYGDDVELSQPPPP